MPKDYADMSSASIMTVLDAHELGNLGHTGYAWAARREFVEHIGFLDTAGHSSGDNLMSICFDSSDLAQLKRATNILKVDVRVGASRFNICKPYFENIKNHFGYVSPRDMVGYVPGVIYDLYHGSAENRAYVPSQVLLYTRDQLIMGVDTVVNELGLWEWSASGIEKNLSSSFEMLFNARNEDDVLNSYDALFELCLDEVS